MTSKFGGALRKLQQVEPQPPTQTPIPPENPNTGMPETMQDDPGAGREKYSTYVDGGLITRLKLYAVRNRLKHREVVEAAIRDYLDRQEGVS